MPSPFPGMNPYLEQDDAWHDFHERFMPLIAERLGSQIDPEYIVKIDEHLFIHELDQGRHLLGRADVAVSAPQREDRGGVMVATLEAPTERYLPTTDVERVSFVEIRDRRKRQLIAVIELLSPTNKRPGVSRDQYLGKRIELLDSSVHLVEIDLLRGGERMPLKDPPPCDYQIIVSRSERRPRVGVWPLTLRDRLPIIPVPLRTGHADARIDLQEAIHHIHDSARYQSYIYDGQPDPPLSLEDSKWAGELIGSLQKPE